MKKLRLVLPIMFAALVVAVLIFRKNPVEVVEEKAAAPEQTTTTTGMANPASVYCEDNGGELQIVSESDGSQFGLCVLGDYSCEEWLYSRGECDISGDEAKIRQALIDKGLSLNNMKVVIKKHLGKYISASVVPITADVGGGYVFAVKDNDEIKILADGNGAIMCTSFDEYPEFSTYLVPECINEEGVGVAR
ncbi:MAG: DUF333 domain-containing protein [Patescibacteria group bacterium]|jgi:hypothetical protein